MTPAQFDAVRIEDELRNYLLDWPSLAQRHPAQARQILRKLLPRRIQVWREVCGNEKRYRFEGEAAVGRFFSELVGVKRSGVPSWVGHPTERPLSFAIALLVEAAGAIGCPSPPAGTISPRRSALPVRGPSTSASMTTRTPLKSFCV